ncbi:hypothetical protein SAMN05444392_11091 [Seinonella peptonophila]|uniref:Uncharacterized protein n=1 Tax=Seinonella peptonophila TaxID=112248 RepID=A0A1M4ZT25_9BACL|nr:hypothetical protein SAMN05444392_11091 [Seinonella peptonophila]
MAMSGQVIELTNITINHAVEGQVALEDHVALDVEVDVGAGVKDLFIFV